MKANVPLIKNHFNEVRLFFTKSSDSFFCEFIKFLKKNVLKSKDYFAIIPGLIPFFILKLSPTEPTTASSRLKFNNRFKA